MKKVIGIVMILSVLSSGPAFAFNLDTFIDKTINKIGDKGLDMADEAIDSALADEPAKEVNTSTSNDLQALKELIQMEKEGYITRDEFLRQKQALLR